MTSRPDNSRWWLLVGLALVACKLWLAASQTVYAVGSAGHDDRLFLLLAKSLLRGEWLGPYNHFTLIKGPMYPLWIAGVFLTGIPLIPAQHLLYAAACAVFVLGLRPLLPRPWLAFLLFAVLLFNPLTCEAFVHGRILRQNIYHSLMLGTVGGLAALALRRTRPLRELIPWAVLAGSSLAAFWLTREEGVWLVPLLALLWGWMLCRIWRERAPDFRRRAALMLSPLALWAAALLIICSLNQYYYGVFATVEFKARPFMDAYGALARVQPQPWRPYVPVTRETRERIYAVSPAFAELRPYLDGPASEGWYLPGETFRGIPRAEHEIVGGWFMWALRDAVAAAGHAHSGAEAMAFYQRLADEVNAACDSGRLAAGPRRSGFFPVWNRAYNGPLYDSTARLAYLLLTLDQVTFQARPSEGPVENLQIFTDLTRGRLEPMAGEPHLPGQQRWLDRVRLPLLVASGQLYRVLALPAFALALVVWLAATVRDLGRRHFSFWLAFNAGLLAAVSAVLLMNAIIDCTSFPSVNPGALTACYPLYFIFLFTAWLQWFDRPAGLIARGQIPAAHPSGCTGWTRRGVPAVFALGVLGLLLGWLPHGREAMSGGMMIARTFTTVALSLVLVLGPGLIWQAWRRSHFVSVLWPGPLVLALGGLVCWIGGGVVRPASLAEVWISGLLIALGVAGWKLRPWLHWDKLERTTLALVALVVLGVAAKAAFSRGPVGELYAGSISRTLEYGDRPDSRIVFHNVQMIAHHLSPYGDIGAGYLAPFNYSHRGPLPGLMAAPVVLAAGLRPPVEMPDQPWVPFDRTGFAAYRILLATFGATALIAAAALLRQLRDDRTALIGVGLLALAPFYWHETFFTWPKLATAAWLVGALTLLLQERPTRAGLAFSGAYLLHPMALLSLPFVGLGALCQHASPWPRRILRATAFTLPIALVAILWFGLNREHYSQQGFMQYLTSAEGGPATWHAWWISRWTSTINTLVPFAVMFTRGDNFSFNPIGLQASPVSQYFFQAWTSLPFAIGLLTWLALLPAFLRGVGRRPGAASLYVLGPLLLTLIYWGAASTGIMRECGHVIFLAGWIFLAWSAGDALPAWIFSGWFLALRALELWLVMYAPAFVPASRPWSAAWAGSDILWLFVSAIILLFTFRVIRRSVAAA
ncbi:MAG: hypothetical protein JSS11_02270 [Verrucomicrobia bacterium]|nr:hypothetical protein [Verrucomicrobiota bacterium]